MKQIILYTLTCTLLFSNLFIENDPDVITGKLDNGITYYIKENNQPEDQIELRLVINAGSSELYRLSFNFVSDRFLKFFRSWENLK